MTELEQKLVSLLKASEEESKRREKALMEQISNLQQQVQTLNEQVQELNKAYNEVVVLLKEESEK